MYNEIMWYVDDNRFSDIIKQIEEFAKEYQDNYYPDSPNHAESKSNFSSLVYYHASKSGYSAKLAPNTDLVSLLVPNGRIDRKALDNFEKEIIKNHMYQKHLWEFMGTTGSFGIITKIGLANNKKCLDDYFPLSYKSDIKLRSPIEPILEDIEDSVPIYIYFDGNISTLYDKNMAGEAFDTTADKSGFDWQMRGYDPNYSLSSQSSSDIVYDTKDDCFSAVGKSSNRFHTPNYLLFPPEAPRPLKLKVMKLNNKVVLQDPFYTYICSAKIVSEKEGFDEYSKTVLTLIDSALEYLGAEKITSIVNYKLKADDDKILKVYSEFLADRADKLSFISLENANKELKKSSKEYTKDALERKGVEVASKLDYLISLGLCGAELESAVCTDTALGALSYKSRADLAQNDLTDEEIDYITRLDVPKEKADEFSHTLFNLLADYSFFSSSIEIIDIANALYCKTIGESFADRNIDVSSTLSRALSTTSTLFDSPARDPRVEERLKMALGEVPDMKKAERLLKAISNAGLRYGYIKALTGMSEKELVNAAVTIFYDNFAPTSSIRYIKGSDPVNQMLFSKIRLSALLEKERINPNEYKSIKPIDYSKLNRHSKYNVFDKKGLEGWLESPNGKKSGLNSEAFENIQRLLVKDEKLSISKSKRYPLSKNKVPLSSYPMDVTPLSAEIRISNFLEPNGNTTLDTNSNAKMTDKNLYNITKRGISNFAFGGW